MIPESSSELHEVIRDLPIRRTRELDIPETVDKFVFALYAVGIEAQPELNGVSYPGDGLPIVDDALSDLIIGIVTRRFQQSLSTDSLESESAGRSIGDGAPLDQVKIHFHGGLNASEMLSRACSLLSVLEVDYPEKQVRVTSGLVAVTESGQHLDDAELIKMIAEIIQRRYSAVRMRERYASRGRE